MGSSWRAACALLICFLLAACSASQFARKDDRLQVVTSTTIIGDVVQQVGGDGLDLTVLMPVGADPHTFEPRPRDIAAISDADLIFLNGLGLEEALAPSLEANATGRVVHVSDGIDVLDFNPAGSAGLNAGGADSDDEVHAHGDPHTWMDPNNVKVWVENIQSALAAADPDNSDTYRSNADSYLAELTALDEWARAETSRVPPERRKLVTDHASLAYFARRYGFEQAGLIVASLSADASPSAQDLAQLEDTLRNLHIPAVFVSTTVNPALAQQIAKDTGTQVVALYTGSLGKPGSGADTYLNFMRYNVRAIVDALE
ncbi:MAG: hypothetical protein B6D39_02725 [Anaerolineae bacterium UTCFX2]|jgi:ABC-type Zn uptake system ZnuABC Zn-binding protein ZnuA|nr:zinc ABC transporter substrate-binding protein [Anaerolineae bacterium]OQY93476.1 MAG: hypothetical protein B6D39_02725 [Anaerolineae bacterium UTCFX2]